MTKTSLQDAPTAAPTLQWELGTAYELIVSLHVIHMPEQYGVRASWAAGVRSRIPPTERKFLEETLPFLWFPLAWASRLPEPRDAISALWALKQIPAAERIPVIFDFDKVEPEHKPFIDLLSAIAGRGAWTEQDLKTFISLSSGMDKHKRDEASVKKFLDRWSRPAEFGELFLSALQAYHQAFFEDEEKRIRPVLEAGLDRARQAAKHLALPDLIAELSKGIHFEEMTKFKELVIAPAYWTTPLIILEKLDEERALFLFGARPDNMAAIPGERVPESLLRTLKALADPTRLKIMHYLTQGEVTPSELARRLNLRAPTVTHHLGELRLCGLVNVTFRGQEKLYTSRLEALDTTCNNLRDFLQNAPDGL